MDSSYTASVFLDANGQYAKDPALVATVRFYVGAVCDHVDITVAEFNAWSAADKAAAKLLPTRPECM